MFSNEKQSTPPRVGLGGGGGVRTVCGRSIMPLRLCRKCNPIIQTPLLFYSKRLDRMIVHSAGFCVTKEKQEILFRNLCFFYGIVATQTTREEQCLYIRNERWGLGRRWTGGPDRRKPLKEWLYGATRENLVRLWMCTARLLSLYILMRKQSC